jgi:hypothetical protein
MKIWKCQDLDLYIKRMIERLFKRLMLFAIIGFAAIVVLNR